MAHDVPFPPAGMDVIAMANKNAFECEAAWRALHAWQRKKKATELFFRGSRTGTGTSDGIACFQLEQLGAHERTLDTPANAMAFYILIHA